MPTQPTKLQRWLDVIAYLAGRRLPVSTEQLWEAVPAYRAGLDGSEREKQTVRRMFERDKDELRRLGIPIETVPYSMHYGYEQTTGYRLATKDFHLPYLRLVARSREDEPSVPRVGTKEFPLDPEEASAALEGLGELSGLPAFPLRTAARSAFRKLAFDLDPEIARDAPVVYAEDPETAASREPLRLASDAVQRRKAVRFRYTGMTRDTFEDREVEPYGLVFQHGRWYLVGRDRDRDSERMFRLGRMTAVALVAPGPSTPDFAVPEDFDLSAYAGRSAWEMGEDSDGPVEADVWFAFPRSLWAERNGHGTLLRAAEDGSQFRRFMVLRREPFLRWVLSLAGDARVVSPAPLASDFQDLVADVITRYHGSVTGHD